VVALEMRLAVTVGAPTEPAWSRVDACANSVTLEGGRVGMGVIYSFVGVVNWVMLAGWINWVITRRPMIALVRRGTPTVRIL
jgi:hypothetical protein